jgi:pyruvate/2-oxoglutarate/acetoin dehydrogenase E1 component
MYLDKLKDAMNEIAKRNDSVFIGQQIVYYGNPMSKTVVDIPKEKMIEVPVMEETQMGMSLGLAMTDKFVVTFYPRWDFLISATNQLVNHIDKFKIMTGKNINMIIRVGKGSDAPLDPGHQHKGNYFEEFKSLCKNIEFHNLKTATDVELAYKYASKEGGVHIFVEYPELY